MVEVGLSRDWQGSLFSGMDPTSFRMRHLLAVVAVAGITAAVLRHFFHVHVGLSREEIRTGALMAAAVGILLAIVIFRRKGRR